MALSTNVPAAGIFAPGVDALSRSAKLLSLKTSARSANSNSPIGPSKREPVAMVSV